MMAKRTIGGGAITVAGVLIALLMPHGLHGAEAVAGDHVSGAAAENESLSALVKHLIAASGARGGLCVNLGLDQGELAAELAGSSRFLVHGLSPDTRQVQLARQRIQERRLHGRASVDQCSLAELPYVDNLVNVVIVDGLPVLLGKGLAVREVVRVLRPGGVALLGGRQGADGRPLTEDRLKALLAGAGVTNCQILRKHGLWARIRKPRAGDRALEAVPSRVQWMAGPTWSRGHFSTLNWSSAGGRIFCVLDEAPTQVEGPARVFLSARDAFNGLLLWKRAMPGTWAYPALRRAAGKLLATESRVYTVLRENGPLVALDAATGRTLKTHDGQSPTSVARFRETLILSGGGPIRSLDPATGKILWRSEADGAFALGDNRVFCLTRKTLVCLEAASGKVVWQKPPPGGRRRLILRGHHRGVLLLAESKGPDTGAVHVVSADDGKHLWSKAYNTPPKGYGRDPLAADGLIWLHVREDQAAGIGWRGLDRRSGEVRKRINYPEHWAGKVRQRCYPNRTAGRFLVTGKDPLYVDRDSGAVHVVKLSRGTCRGGGFLFANALVYTGPQLCHCYPMLRGFVALAAGRETDSAAGAARSAARLEKGPMFGKALAFEKSEPGDDWPYYRHDALRSAVTPTTVPARLRALWRRRVGGRISSPTIADGRLFVASMDTHQVLAFNAATGRALWSFTAGGPIDTPPTLHRGACLFGSRDGWVYCLAAADGRLVWRFRAAPRDRRIVVDGRLESAWPVFGSVVIHERKVFLTAGRHGRVEGGIVAWALDVLTGQPRWRKRLRGEVVSDILVSDGQSICLPALRFDSATGRTAQVDRWKPTQLRGGRAGLLDGSLAIREGAWSSPVGGGRLLVLDIRTSGDAAPTARRAYALTTRARNDQSSKQGAGEWKLTVREGRKSGPAWELAVPIRPRAMLLADATLFLAGTPDAADPGEPWAAIDGARGALLWAVSAAKGTRLSETQLDAPPVWDGLAATDGRLYASLSDGTVLCLEGAPE